MKDLLLWHKVCSSHVQSIHNLTLYFEHTQYRPRETAITLSSRTLRQHVGFYYYGAHYAHATC